MIDKNSLANNLTALGVKKGDCVMLHSSLSALGFVEGGADAVFDAFIQAIGPEGTLVTPAFTRGAWFERLAMDDCNMNCTSETCPSQSPSNEGAIPNAVLKRKGRIRGCHPTHSWVAYGKHAYDICKDTYKCQTLCGKGTAFEKVVELDGCIVTLGVMVNTVTFWHYLEDVLELPYLGYYHPAERHLSYCTDGRRIQYEFPGVMQEVVKAVGLLKEGRVGKSTSGIMRAREFRRFMATIVNDDPYCFIVRPPDRTCGSLAVDAMNKGAAMIRAYETNPIDINEIDLHSLPNKNTTQETVREDCPAFAGWHEAGEKKYSLCRANDRHPELFRNGGIFNKYGKTTCGYCPWHLKFPKK